MDVFKIKKVHFVQLDYNNNTKNTTKNQVYDQKYLNGIDKLSTSSTQPVGVGLPFNRQIYKIFKSETQPLAKTKKI